MKWLVLLDVKKSDFDNLSNLLRSSDEFSVITENSKYYLTSSRWESLTNVSDVYLEATKPLQDISAVARIQFTGFPLLKPDMIYEVDEEGKRHGWSALSATINVGSSCSVSIKLEGGQDIIRNLEFESWMKLAEEDETVKNVFRQITDFDHNWINLFKVNEIVNKDAGKIKKIHRIEQWINKDKIRDFKHTANSQSAIGDDARHGVDRNDPPKEPMSLYEADALIMTLLQKWLQWKCEQQK
jgi:hypothetical protein